MNVPTNTWKCDFCGKLETQSGPIDPVLPIPPDNWCLFDVTVILPPRATPTDQGPVKVGRTRDVARSSICPGCRKEMVELLTDLKNRKVTG